MASPQKGVALLSGSLVETSSNHFETTNPANIKDVLAIFGSADVKQVEKACLRAKGAFKKWKRTPAPVRASVIQNWGRLIEENKEALSCLLTREMGKPIKEARGDVQEAIDTCNFFVSEGRRLYGMTLPSELPNKELYTYRRPIGVFACITAGNFPVAVPAWYFVPALLSGNTCVWKPSADVSLTSYYFAQLLFKAGVPEGVFNVLFGKGSLTGAQLIDAVNKGWVDKFGFTGSTEIGVKIGETCGKNLQNACLELGGKNPMVVMEDANLDLATTGALWGGFGTAGQRCTSLGNLILHEKVKKPFLELFLKKLSAVKIGDPRNEEITYGPMISENFMNDHLKNLETLVDSQHKLLTDPNGRITKKRSYKNFIGADPDGGFFCFPTVVDGVTMKDKIYSTETFGPLFNVMTCKNLEEGIEMANGTGYGLSSAIYTNTPAYVYEWKEEIFAGMTSINNSTTGAEAHLPFGGNGKSGNGSRQSGVWVLDQFTKWQAVNWDLSGKLQLAQMETGYIKSDLEYRI